MKRNDHLHTFRTVVKLEKYINTTSDINLQNRLRKLIEVRKNHLVSIFGHYPENEQEIKKFRRREGFERAQKTIKLKYNVDSIMNIDSIKNQIVSTNLSRYGHEYYTQTQDYKKLMHNKNMTARYNNLILQHQVEPCFNLKFYLEKSWDPNYKFNWHCLTCGTNFSSKFIRSEYTPARCPKCHPISRTSSKGEKEVAEFIKSLGILVKENVRSIITPLELDIVCEKEKICFEYDGLYYHSTNVCDDKNYHFNKTENCRKKGYRLVHIFESDWLIRKEICKSNIRRLFNKIDKVIYHSECTIKEIDTKEYRKFVTENYLESKILDTHIQYGLYHNNELVSVMGFIRHNLYDNYWYITCYCDKNNIEVKNSFYFLLLEFWINHENVYSIQYSIDMRWNYPTELQYKLGFEIIARTAPSYYYYMNPDIESRLDWTKDLQRKKLEKFDENLSESDNMLLNHHPQVYNSGYMILEWKNKEMERL